MRQAILLTALVCGVQVLFAQNIVHKGVIMSKDAPLEGVSVLVNGKKGAVTGKNGSFLLQSTEPVARVRLSAVGYQPLVAHLKGGEATDTLYLVPVAARLNDVVVSGTLRPVSKLESPIPVEVYTPALFKKNPAPNIFENLTMVNGVQPQLNCNVCNTGDIHINGMEGPYTMILIDGMPIVSSLSTVYGLAGIPSSLIKQVEVVKGPASTLYGSEAVGGLINIITKDAAQGEKVKVDLMATSVGEYNTDVSARLQAGKSWTLLGINHFNYGQRRDINHDNFTDVALQNRISVFNKWSFYRADNLKASLAGRYVYENRWGGEMQWTPAHRGGNQVYGESILTNRAELLGNYDIDRNVSADISYNYHHQNSWYGTTPYMASQHVAFAQVKWNATVGRHHLLVGLPFRYTFYDDNSPATAKDGQNAPSHTLLPGVFVQDEWKWTDKFTALTGLRLDHHNAHGAILSPRLSLKYNPGKNSVLRLSTGNGFRVVNLFTEDHAALTGARQVVITEALNPEQSWNANINYTHKVTLGTGYLELDGSAFYTRFTNKIVGDFLTDPNKIIYSNLSGYAVSKGFTLNTSASLAHRFKVNAGITLMDVYQVEQNDNGEDVRIPQLFAPKFSGTYAFSYSIPRYAVNIDLTGRVNGPMYLPVVPNDFRPEQSPLYNMMNLQVSKIFSQKWEVYAGAKNLLNFIPRNPLLHPDDPFDRPGGKYFDAAGNPRPDTNPNGYTFDPSYNYASVQGLKGFVGVRWSW